MKLAGDNPKADYGERTAADDRARGAAKANVFTRIDMALLPPPHPPTPPPPPRAALARRAYIPVEIMLHDEVVSVSTSDKVSMVAQRCGALVILCTQNPRPQNPARWHSRVVHEPPEKERHYFRRSGFSPRRFAFDHVGRMYRSLIPAACAAWVG